MNFPFSFLFFVSRAQALGFSPVISNLDSVHRQNKPQMIYLLKQLESPVWSMINFSYQNSIS